MLFLLHGWGLNRRVFAGLEGALDIPTRSLDMPGHGEAPYAPGALDPDTLAARLAAAHPGAHAWLGWSLGGLVALTLAARHPQSVSRLVLVGATPRFVRTPDWPHGTEPAVLQTFADQLAIDHAATVRRFLTLQAGPGARPEARALMADLQTGGMPQPAALAEGLAVLQGSDRRALLSSIRAPVLFVHAASDAIVPIEAARAASRLVPNGRLHEAGRGHAPFLNAEACVATLIRDFLSD